MESATGDAVKLETSVRKRFTRKEERARVVSGTRVNRVKGKGRKARGGEIFAVPRVCATNEISRKLQVTRRSREPGTDERDEAADFSKNDNEYRAAARRRHRSLASANDAHPLNHRNGASHSQHTRTRPRATRAKAISLTRAGRAAHPQPLKFRLRACTTATYGMKNKSVACSLARSLPHGTRISFSESERRASEILIFCNIPSPRAQTHRTDTTLPRPRSPIISWP